MDYRRRISALARFAIATGAGFLLAADVALAAVFAPQFTIFGDVQHPRTFSYADLAALPSVTKTVTFQAGSNMVTTTFTGVDLWTLLNSTELKLDQNIKNDVLRKFVVATGSDDYEAAFSLGELSPLFGNQPDFIAYNENGVPITADGFARVVVPNDVRGGRYVSNLVSLWVGDVGTVPAHLVPEPGPLALLAAGLVIVMMRRSSRNARV